MEDKMYTRVWRRMKIGDVEFDQSFETEDPDMIAGLFDDLNEAANTWIEANCLLLDEDSVIFIPESDEEEEDGPFEKEMFKEKDE
jgi:hypothetical protein